MSHALFLVLLHGRGVFRAALKLATMAGVLGLLLFHALSHHAPGIGIGSGWQAVGGRALLQVLLLALIPGGWVLQWRYDALLRRLCSTDATLLLPV